MAAYGNPPEQKDKESIDHYSHQIRKKELRPKFCVVLQYIDTWIYRYSDTYKTDIAFNNNVIMIIITCIGLIIIIQLC